MMDNEIIEDVLRENNIAVNDVDQFIVDGWIGDGLNSGKTKITNLGRTSFLELAPYHERMSKENILRRFLFEGLKIGKKKTQYASFMHASGHILSAYCTSPFAQGGQESFVLIWDGGMHPRLYFISPALNRIINLGTLFPFGANIYSIFSQNYGPFKINSNVIKDELSIAGKIMAYVACGSKNNLIIKDLNQAYLAANALMPNYKDVPSYPYLFAEKFRQIVYKKQFSDEDIITSFHHFIEDLLLSELQNKVVKSKIVCPNLCMSGGAALNIKWNSAIRKSGIFEEIWIPPFPNDSGSAIGTACCELVLKHRSIMAIDWDVYRGPKISRRSSILPEGWLKRKSSIEELAALLHRREEPIVVLNGNAEIGPRALGNRSILASPIPIYMKDRLNNIKYREDYRPIAPICLEKKASQYFDPGLSDPYMLFEHTVKAEFRELLPAICHLDGTARLQTVSTETSPFLAQLLEEFERISGFPILCNTSANFKGSGFFPDVESVIRWGRVKYIWFDGYILEKEQEIKPLKQNSMRRWDNAML